MLSFWNSVLQATSTVCRHILELLLLLSSFDPILIRKGEDFVEEETANQNESTFKEQDFLCIVLLNYIAKIQFQRNPISTNSILASASLQSFRKLCEDQTSNNKTTDKIHMLMLQHIAF